MRAVRVVHQSCAASLSYLQLNEGEATTSAYTAVVLDGWASDDGPKSVHWTWSKLGGLLVTGRTSALLAAGLR